MNNTQIKITLHQEQLKFIPPVEDFVFGVDEVLNSYVDTVLSIEKLIVHVSLSVRFA